MSPGVFPTFAKMTIVTSCITAAMREGISQFHIGIQKQSQYFNCCPCPYMRVNRLMVRLQ